MPFDQTTGSSSNVVAFRQARPQSYSRRDQKNLMEAVYSAGSLPVLADDRATKAMAARLQLFGFVVIEEIDADGTARRLRASEAIDVSPARPWRVSKPSAGRKGIGAADASGYLAAGARPLPAPGAPIAAQASGSGARLRQHPTITAPAGSDQAPCS
jgi:hypothetical protein